MGLNALNVVKYTGIGFCAWLTGIITEKYSQGDISATEDSQPLQFLKAFSGFLNTASAAGKFAPQLPPEPPKTASIATQLLRFGMPKTTSILTRSDYMVSYDHRLRIPIWTLEHLTKERTKRTNDVDRSKCLFTEDEALPQIFRSTNDDYHRSGYDRGHMAAAGNHRLCQEHCDHTFFYTNIAPQVGEGFNRHSWNRLEKYCRRLTKYYKNVYVITGPVFSNRLYSKSEAKRYVQYHVIGPNNVAVPTDFYKVIIKETDDNQVELEAYCMPNAKLSDDVPLTSYLVSLEQLQKKTGIIFFDQVDRAILKSINKPPAAFTKK